MENNFEELQDDLKNLELIALNEKAENAALWQWPPLRLPGQFYSVCRCADDDCGTGSFNGYYLWNLWDRCW